MSYPIELDYIQFDWTKLDTSLSWDGRKKRPIQHLHNGMYAVATESPSRKTFNATE